MSIKTAHSLLALALLAGATAAAAPEAKRSYEIEAHIFSVEGRLEKSDIEQTAAELDDDKLRTALRRTEHGPFLHCNRFHVAGHVLELRDTGITWDGNRSADEVSGVEAVAAPRLTTLEGEQAAIHIGHENLQYFERLDDGTFRLHTSKNFVGHKFATLIESSDTKGHVQCTMDIVSSIVTKREPIEGTDLDIGLPTVDQSGTSIQSIVPLNQWAVLPFAAGARTTVLCLLVRETTTPPQP